MRYLNKIIEYGILLLVFLIPWQARWIISIGQINGGEPARIATQSVAGGWEYGTQSVYVTEILLAGILMLAVIRFFVETRYVASHKNHETISSHASNETPGMASLQGPVGILFLIYAGLSIFWAIDKNTALIHWRYLVEAGVVMLLIGSFVETRYIASHGTHGQNETPGPPAPRLRRVNMASLHWMIILSALLQAVVAIGQFLLQSIPGSTILGIAHQGAEVLGTSVVETAGGRWLRAYGSWPHPNILGAWLVLGLIILTRICCLDPQGEAPYTRKPAYKRFLPRGYGVETTIKYASFVIILFGLLVTFSRAAWLAFGIFLLGAILLSLRGSPPRADDRSNPSAYPRDCFAPLRFARNDIIKLFAITILTVIVFNSLFPNLLSARVDNQNRLEAKATSERLVGFSQSWQIIKNNPLVGAGIGNYGLAVRDEIDSNQPAWYYQPVHNVGFLIWAELGLVGLLVMGYWLWVMGRRSIIWLIPLAPLFLLDHYLWSLYPGLIILAVWLGLLTRPQKDV